MKIFHSLPLFLALSAVVLPGCRAKNPLGAAPNGFPLDVPTAPETPKMPIFQVTARANKTEFAVDQPLEFTIEIRNISEKSAALEFTSGQKFDVSATPVGKPDQIWSYGMNKRFAQMLSTVTLDAGKSLEYKTTWNGAPAGTYSVATVVMANGGLKAMPFEVVVK